MHPFGIIVLIILILIFFKSKNLKTIYIKLLTFAICLEAFFDVGYFIKLGSYEFSYIEFVLSILAILSVILIAITPINQKLMFFGYLLIFAVVMSNIFLIIDPFQQLIISYGMSWEKAGVYPSFNIQTIKMSLRIIIVILISIATINIVKKDDIEHISKIFVKTGIFFLIVGVIEFVTKNIFHSNILNTVIGFVFGTGDYTVTFLLVRDGLVSLQGITREPAHFCSVLFSFCLILLLSKTKIKYFNLVFFTAVIEMLLSRSLGGVLLTAGILIIYCILKNKLLLGFFLIACVSPFIFYSQFFTYYLDRLINVMSFFNNFEQNFAVSEQFRLYSVYVNFEIFLAKPFFGIGVGTSYAYGFLPTILANLGIIGLILWILFMFLGVGGMSLTFKNSFLLIVLLILWIPTGNLATMYSLPLMLAMLNLRTHSIKGVIQNSNHQLKH